MTRLEVESSVLRVTRTALDLAGIPVVPDDEGYVEALNDSLRAGLIALGIRPAAWTVTDTDLSGVDGANEDTLIKVAMLNTLDLVFFNWNRPDVTDNGSSQKWSGLYDNLWKLAARLRTEVDDLLGRGTLTAGGIRLGYRSGCDDQWEGC